MQGEFIPCELVRNVSFNVMHFHIMSTVFIAYDDELRIISYWYACSFVAALSNASFILNVTCKCHHYIICL